MEDTNPWLDDEVPHINQKAERPEPRKPFIKPKKKHNKKKKEEEIPKEENSKEDLCVSTLVRDDKIDLFIKTLLDELDYLPEASKQFAIENFGKEWLNDFTKDIEDVKYDISHSRFYPTQDKMILLKFIFLLQQAF